MGSWALGTQLPVSNDFVVHRRRARPSTPLRGSVNTMTTTAGGSESDKTPDPPEPETESKGFATTTTASGANARDQMLESKRLARKVESKRLAVVSDIVNRFRPPPDSGNGESDHLASSEQGSDSPSPLPSRSTNPVDRGAPSTLPIDATPSQERASTTTTAAGANAIGQMLESRRFARQLASKRVTDMVSNDPWKPDDDDPLRDIKGKIRHVVLAHGGAVDFSKLQAFYKEIHGEAMIENRNMADFGAVKAAQMLGVRNRVHEFFSLFLADVVSIRRRRDGGTDIVAVGMSQPDGGTDVVAVGSNTFGAAKRKGLLLTRLKGTKSSGEILRLVYLAAQHDDLNEVQVVLAALNQLALYVWRARKHHRHGDVVEGDEDREALSSLFDAVATCAKHMVTFEWKEAVYRCKSLSSYGVEVDPAAMRALAQESVGHFSTKTAPNPRRRTPAANSAMRFIHSSAIFVKFGSDLVDEKALLEASKIVTSESNKMSVSVIMRVRNACAVLLHHGVAVDPAMIAALDAQAPRIKATQSFDTVLQELQMIEELLHEGIATDAERVREVSSRMITILAYGKVTGSNYFTRALQTFADIAELGMHVDPTALQIVSGEAGRYLQAETLEAAVHYDGRLPYRDARVRKDVSFALRSLVRLEESGMAVDLQTVATLRELLEYGSTDLPSTLSK
mmetsp:Transcript_5779/g.14327  ORF Transcript_5779/g.14327 Transcript_5779/m.14327 type:complete len:680 (-) Transcript_5779:96-2135(-)